MNKYEILAPAGSVEQLQAAVNNGCDAVYLGLEGFNARMKAPNFTTQNLREWVDFCHTFGVKVYVTVNTSVKNDEFMSAFDLIWQAYRCLADGVIVTDLALLVLAASLPKPFDVVASTQLNCHDRLGAEFLKNLGATTVVCSRECSYSDISAIASTGVKTECFLHGALCVCQSGQCLFSSIVGGNSGNRGLCAQPCRKKYYASSGKSGYLLSARDLSGVGVAKKLARAGASVFKIEGRNRRAEYAGVTSRVFSEMFRNGFEATDKDKTDLAEVFNRGNTSSIAYLQGGNDNIVYPQQQNHIGVKIGVVRRGKIVSDVEISKGDGFKVFDGDKEVCGAVATSCGTTVTAEFSARVFDGMTVNRTTSVALSNEVLSARRKLPTALNFSAKAGQPIVLSAKTNDVSVRVISSEVAQPSINLPTSTDEIVKQLQKSGDSYSTITDIVVEKDDIFIAKSQLNALRREVLQKLQQAVLDRYNSALATRTEVRPSENELTQRLGFTNQSDFAEQKQGQSGARSDIEPCVAVTCKNENELKQAKSFCKYLVYKPQFIDEKSAQTAVDYDAFLDIPPFADCDFLRNLLGEKHAKILCHNVAHVQLARLLGLPYIAGRGLNVYNDNIAKIFADAETLVYSYELTLAEISRFSQKNGLVFVDGELPLMQLAHCPFKVAFGCDCKSCKADKTLTYTDEQNNVFAIQRRKDTRCRFELINGKKLSAANKIVKRGRYLIDFDAAVLQHYCKLNNGVNDGYVCRTAYTKGRLFDKIN